MNKNYELEHAERVFKINEALKEMEINFTVEFVPFSRSRNAKENPKIDDLSINWKVTLKRGNSELTTDYMQGIGHLPDNIKPNSFKKIYVDQGNEIKSACETGKVGRWSDVFSRVIDNKNKKLLDQPKVEDVVYSLLMDSDVLNYGSFEDWTSGFGYDTDSRKAEKIYNECMKIALKMRGMFGDANLQKLNNLYQDF